jgi:hypothetical protein
MNNTADTLSDLLELCRVGGGGGGGGGGYSVSNQ